MRWGSILKVAMQSILRHRMRSFLTMLGIIIGVGSVILMVAIGQGVQEQIKNQIAGLGSNLLMVFPQAAQSGGVSAGAGTQDALTLDDVEKIEREGLNVTAVSPVTRVGVQAIGGIGNWSTSVQGVSPDYLTIRDWALTSGVFFTEQQVNSRAKVCVIGATVAQNLYPGQDPVGEQIRLRNVPFTIIGVLAAKGQGATGQDQDDAVLAPVTTVLDRLSGRRFIQQILVRAASEEQMIAAQNEVAVLLRESHKIGPGEDDNFRIQSQTEIAEAAEATTATLTLLLASIAGVSLVVGGIGIMNIMLVSVTERTREIGIRLSIGARGRDVLTQFLVEAVVLSGMGGLIGIALGVGGSFLVAELTELAPRVNPIVALIAALFSAAVGIFFGFYPARKAAALNPIEALRYE